MGRSGVRHWRSYEGHPYEGSSTCLEKTAEFRHNVAVEPLTVLRVPTNVKGLKRLWHSSTKPLEPSWCKTPYGEASRGLWYEANTARKGQRHLMHLWAV